MASSHFASRHRKDLSTDMIRTKIARRKSLSQKENRHKEYERNRHIGLKDSNIPILQGRILAPLEETSQELAPEKASAKPRSTKTVLNDQRKKMLHKYKEEKQLQKLKEQREKAKRGVFKVGLYRPDMPGFLLSHSKPTTVKPDPNQAVSSARITRSRAKEQMDQTKVNNGRTIQTIQPSQRPASEKKVPDKEKKAVKLVAPTAVRITRSATQATNQIPKTASSTTTRRPVSRATNGNELERKLPIKGRPVKNTEPNPDKDTTFKVENNETSLDLQASAINEMDPDGTLSNEEILPKTNATKMKGKNSFAPKDFVFQPLDGVKIYQAASMIPRTANSLLTPYSWSPLKAEVDESEEATKDPLAPKCKAPSSETVRRGSTPGHWPLGSLAVNKEDDLAKNEDATTSSTGPPGKEAPSPKMTGGLMSPPQHDVPYFRNILQSETEKLTSSCLAWNQKLELDIPDDAKDLIRTTVGQTRLLMKERFKQFEGLVNDCEYKRGEKETTCTDLDGFWDMVSFQIDDVNQKFNNLSKLEESNWQHNSNTSKKTVRKKGVSNITNKPKQDGGGRIAARNRLAAIKNAMRERMKQEEQAEAADSVVPTTVDTIVFDAGFFRIESPVKSFSGLSISAAHRSQRLRTPKSVGKAVSQSRAQMNLLRPTTTLGNSDSQCTKEEHVKTLPSDLPDNRSSSVGEDAQCPTVQDRLDVNHDANKINFEMDCLPCDRMNISLLAVEVTNNTENIEEISEVVEGMELNSSIVEEDVLMSSSDKQLPIQSNISQQDETEVSLGQSVLIDKSITVECHLLDSA